MTVCLYRTKFDNKKTTNSPGYNKICMSPTEIDAGSYKHLTLPTTP